MKNSIKTILVLSALSGFSIAAKAQTGETQVKTGTGIVYSLGVESGVSTGDFNKSHRWNVGGSFQADIPVAANLYITANAGYNNFFGKNNLTDISLIPVKGGIKYFPLEILYVQAEAGAAFATNKPDVGFERTAAFIYAPQVGVRLQLGQSNSYIDAGVRYEGSSRFTSAAEGSKVNFFGLRLAYALATK
ncbi:hypothetical protein ACFQZI_06880 [Mucilaginibacter lutimaris]|uniref:Outer membrane protein beta-barrel domain-containing protein n=1 Tax=Mucilaginibacter lutimaris TaxID=931629 RepID=A0ABW2ZED7_9SPHI